MKIIIHRGTHEIGGSCVEIRSKKSRILINIGMPLVKKDGDRFNFKEHEHLMSVTENLREITKKQRYVTRLSLNEILKYQDKKSRDQAMYEAHQQYGYTLKDIAEYIGVHYTTVSKVIKRIEGEDEK